MFTVDRVDISVKYRSKIKTQNRAKKLHYYSLLQQKGNRDLLTLSFSFSLPPPQSWIVSRAFIPQGYHENFSLPSERMILWEIPWGARTGQVPLNYQAEFGKQIGSSNDTKFLFFFWSHEIKKKIIETVKYLSGCPIAFSENWISSWLIFSLSTMKILQEFMNLFQSKQLRLYD